MGSIVRWMKPIHLQEQTLPISYCWSCCKNKGNSYNCKEEAQDTPNIVTSTFSIQAQLIDVLFDFGATHSFISMKLLDTLGLVPTHRPTLVSVTFPDRNIMKYDELYKDCPIQTYEHEFPADLYKFELTDFGVILGMDWLAKYQAQINYTKQRITLRGPNKEKIVHKGNVSKSGMKLITVMKAHKLLDEVVEIP